MFFKKTIKVKIEVSARHCHLTQENVEKLFGQGYQLTKFKDLSQPGEFASNEFVGVRTAKGEFKKIRVLGPTRNYSQVELSKTDGIFLGLQLECRESGDIANTPGITLVGPNGEVELKEGAVSAIRHIHASSEQAKKYGFKHGQFVTVKIQGPRALAYNQVMIKVNDNYDWYMHLDTDEGNAAGVDKDNDSGEVII